MKAKAKRFEKEIASTLADWINRSEFDYDMAERLAALCLQIAFLVSYIHRDREETVSWISEKVNKALIQIQKSEKWADKKFPVEQIDKKRNISNMETKT